MIGKQLNYDYPARLHQENDLRYCEDIVVEQGRLEEGYIAEQLNNLGYSNADILASLDVMDDVILFCKDYGAADLILYYKKFERRVITIFDSRLDGFNLNFSGDIDAAYKLNDSSEIELAFTDGTIPYFMNIGTRDRLQLSKYQTEYNDVKLFPDDDVRVSLSFDLNSEGNLDNGVYFFTTRYFYESGKYSNYSGFSRPIVISDNGGININVTQERKPTYDGIVIYCFRNGEVTEIYKQLIDDNDFTYNYNSNTGTTVTLDSVTIGDAIYSEVSTLGVVDNQLILGGVTESNYRNINLQPYLNDLDVKLNIDMVDYTTDIKDSDQYFKTFRPGEVYAIYLKPIFNDGSWGRAYHIPANYVKVPLPTYNTTISFDEGSEYPLNGGFPVGNVRNHKFPSIAELYEAATRDLSPLDIVDPTELGVSKLPTYSISINLSGIIPDSILSNIREWKLYYAEKTLSNSIVIDEAQMVFGAKPKLLQTKSASIGVPEDEQNREVAGYVPSAGNLSRAGKEHVQRLAPPEVESPDGVGKYVTYNEWDWYIKPDMGQLRLQSPEIVTNKYDLPKEFNIVIDQLQMCNPSYSYRTAEEPFATDTPDNFNESIEAKPYGAFVDYRFYDYINDGKGGSAHKILVNTNDVDNVEYVISGTTTAANNNVVGEDALVIECALDSNIVWDTELGKYSMSLDNPGIFDPADVELYNSGVDDEDLGIVVDEMPDLLAKCTIYSKGNAHPSFWSDTLVATESIFEGDTISTKMGGDGDVFLGEYTAFYSAPCSSKNLGNLARNSPSDYVLGGYMLNSGVKVFRKTIGYSRLHLESRTQNTPESTFKNIEDNSVEYFRTRDLRNSQLVTIDPTYSKLSNFDSASIHNDSVFYNDTFKYPFRIHSSQSQSWRMFPPMQTQDIDKSIGAIQAIIPYGDKVYLHFEYGLYVTRDKTSLKSDTVSVYLGTTNFLEVFPQQILPEYKGIGLQYKRLKLKTKLGYLFISRDSKLYLIGDKIEEISSYLFRDFFKNIVPNIDARDIELGYNSKEEKILMSVKDSNNRQVTNTLENSTVGDIVEVDGLIYKVMSYGI